MTTQVVFKTDEDLKKSAIEKAKQEGMTLKAVLTYFMRSYVAGDIELGTAQHDINGFTKDAREDLLKTLKDPKNITTGSFETKSELFSHLHTLSK